MNPNLPWRAGTAPDFGREAHCLLGLPIDAVDMAQAVDRVRHCVRLRRPCFLSTPNLNFLIASQSDEAFRKSVIDSDLVIADGMPLVWMARLLGIPFSERVAGSGLMERLRLDCDSEPLRVYFLGGQAGVAQVACQALNRERSGLCCVGWENPGFGSIAEMSSQARIDRINASGADFLIVSLGARKGQAWIQHNRRRLTVPVVSHLGAVINFVAGNVARAPAWMQKSGLEWLWRIKEEPALWRRYWQDGSALLHLFLTRVLPLCWLQWRHRPRPEALAAASIETDATAQGLLIRLRGTWVRNNLPALRDCLSQEALTGKDLQIDMQAVTYVDSACLGLLLLLQGYQARQGKCLRIHPVPARLRRIFKYGCAEFLL